MKHLLKPFYYLLVFFFICVINSCKPDCDCRCASPENKLFLIDTASLGSMDSLSVLQYDSGTMQLQNRWLVEPVAEGNYLLLRLKDLNISSQGLNASIFRLVNKTQQVDFLFYDFKVKPVESVTPSSKSPFRNDDDCSCRCNEVKVEAVRVDAQMVSELPYIVH